MGGKLYLKEIEMTKLFALIFALAIGMPVTAKEVKLICNYVTGYGEKSSGEYSFDPEQKTVDGHPVGEECSKLTSKEHCYSYRIRDSEVLIEETLDGRDYRTVTISRVDGSYKKEFTYPNGKVNTSIGKCTVFKQAF